MARKTKRRTSLAETEAPDTRTPERRFLDHLAVVEPLKADLDGVVLQQRTANAAYRAALKNAKRDGVDIDAMVQMFKLRKMEPEDSTRYFHNLYNACVWGDVPIGGTKDLFGSKSPATAAEDRKIAADGKSKPEAKNGTALKGALKLSAADAKLYQEGWETSAAGHPFKQRYPEGTPAAMAFENGWMDHQEHLARELTPGSGGNGKSKAELAAEKRRAAKGAAKAGKAGAAKTVKPKPASPALGLEQTAGSA